MGGATRHGIFISYAREDGAELAQKLFEELSARGFHPWLDTASLHGGDSWTVEIEQAIDAADTVLTLFISVGHCTSVHFDHEASSWATIRPIKPKMTATTASA